MTKNLGSLINLLQEYPGVLAWFLLGSAAKGTMRPDSDVDLAVLPKAGIILDRQELVRWAGVLSLSIGHEVDLGIIDQNNLVYAKEALTTGQLLMTGDEGMLRRRSAELMALYLHFQEDRKEVLDAYRAR